jgi:hypothetical protein
MMKFRHIGLLRLHLINHFCYSLQNPEVSEFIDKSFSAQKKFVPKETNQINQTSWTTGDSDSDDSCSFKRRNIEYCEIFDLEDVIRTN